MSRNMNIVLDFLKEMEKLNPDLKEKIKNNGFWRECVISHLNWKFRNSGDTYRAIYLFLDLEKIQ